MNTVLKIKIEEIYRSLGTFRRRFSWLGLGKKHLCEARADESTWVHPYNYEEGLRWASRFFKSPQGTIVLYGMDEEGHSTYKIKLRKNGLKLTAEIQTDRKDRRSE